MSRVESNAAPLDLEFSLVAETPGPPSPDQEQLRQLVGHVLAQEHANGPWDITVALVDDDRLQALHRDFMGIDTPTDIMTFPMAEGREALLGGELVISVDHVRTRAGDWGLTPEEEIRFLVVHGMLHLLGWRDEDPAERARMLDRQRELLEQWRAGARTTP